jgi:hypothetical protein
MYTDTPVWNDFGLMATALRFLLHLYDPPGGDVLDGGEGTGQGQGIRGVADGDGFKDKNGDPVDGFMEVIADKQISEIQSTLDTTEIGEFMGYEKDGSEWKKDGVAAGALMQKVCSRNMDNLGDLMDNLVISDVIPAPDGLLEYVDGNTKITELDAAFEDLFTDTSDGITIGQLKEKGLVPDTIRSAFDTYTFASFMQLASEQMTVPTP